MADDRNTNPPSTDPNDEENIVIDTTSTEPLREAQIKPAETDPRGDPDTDPERARFISPRFGSAGSGGAEFEPGPPRGPDSA
ncbi:MAG: hypothetical protein M3365_08750 [Gemmatimonadota bacterium]|nr:hypothetical protein [Gemmatimonadota bacterium]